jgi:hypothetical protein
LAKVQWNFATGESLIGENLIGESRNSLLKTDAGPIFDKIVINSIEYKINKVLIELEKNEWEIGISPVQYWMKAVSKMKEYSFSHC